MVAQDIYFRHPFKAFADCSHRVYSRNAQAKLEKRGFKVKIPHTANKMKKSGDFDIKTYKTWFKNPNDYRKKTKLMRQHFKKVLECDAILVLNHEKNGVEGYIGGNGLMEMALAFHYRKPIYVLNPVFDTSPFYEEILGMNPIFLNGELLKL